MLIAEKLKKKFGKNLAVKDVSLKVDRGVVVGLLGPNGAGKTTTFKMIAGFIFPDSGRIIFNNRDITFLPVYERARAGITYLPQESSVFRGLSVEDNLIVVLEHRGLPRREAVKKAWELIEAFGLRGREKQKAYTLSGGERRRLEVARAISIDPEFILLDEPFTGIDPKMIAELKDIIISLKHRGIGIIISDHNVRDTLSICDIGYIIADGTIIAEGVPAELVNDEKVKNYYLGEGFTI